MKNKISIWMEVLVFIAISFILPDPAMAGQTKNDIIFDCDKPIDDSVMCLACNIYHEARSEHPPGLWLVALATKNRVVGSLYPLKKAGPKVEKEGFTSEYCKVVYEQRYDKKRKRWVPMFSWTRDGKHDRIYNSGNWLDALELSSKIIAWHYGNSNENIVDITFGCQWYHRYDISPYWMKDYHPTVRIGAHQCYSRNEDVYLEQLGAILPNLGVLRAISDENKVAIFSID